MILLPTLPKERLKRGFCSIKNGDITLAAEALGTSINDGVGRLLRFTYGNTVDATLNHLLVREWSSDEEQEEWCHRLGGLRHEWARTFAGLASSALGEILRLSSLLPELESVTAPSADIERCRGLLVEILKPAPIMKGSVEGVAKMPNDSEWAQYIDVVKGVVKRFCDDSNPIDILEFERDWRILLAWQAELARLLIDGFSEAIDARINVVLKSGQSPNDDPALHFASTYLWVLACKLSSRPQKYMLLQATAYARLNRLDIASWFFADLLRLRAVAIGTEVGLDNTDDFRYIPSLSSIATIINERTDISDAIKSAIADYVDIAPQIQAMGSMLNSDQLDELCLSVIEYVRSVDRESGKLPQQDFYALQAISKQLFAIYRITHDKFAPNLDRRRKIVRAAFYLNRYLTGNPVHDPSSVEIKYLMGPDKLTTRFVNASFHKKQLQLRELIAAEQCVQFLQYKYIDRVLIDVIVDFLIETGDYARASHYIQKVEFVRTQNTNELSRRAFRKGQIAHGRAGSLPKSSEDRLSHLTDAIAQFDEAIRLEPENPHPAIFMLKAQAQRKAGLYEDAFTTLREMHETDDQMKWKTQTEVALVYTERHRDEKKGRHDDRSKAIDLLCKVVVYSGNRPDPLAIDLLIELGREDSQPGATISNLISHNDLDSRGRARIVDRCTEYGVFDNNVISAIIEEAPRLPHKRYSESLARYFRHVIYFWYLSFDSKVLDRSLINLYRGLEYNGFDLGFWFKVFDLSPNEFRDYWIELFAEGAIDEFQLRASNILLRIPNANAETPKRIFEIELVDPIVRCLKLGINVDSYQGCEVSTKRWHISEFYGEFLTPYSKRDSRVFARLGLNRQFEMVDWNLKHADPMVTQFWANRFRSLLFTLLSTLNSHSAGLDVSSLSFAFRHVNRSVGCLSELNVSQEHHERLLKEMRTAQLSPWSLLESLPGEPVVFKANLPLVVFESPVAQFENFLGQKLKIEGETRFMRRRQRSFSWTNQARALSRVFLDEFFGDMGTTYNETLEPIIHELLRMPERLLAKLGESNDQSTQLRKAINDERRQFSASLFAFRSSVPKVIDLPFTLERRATRFLDPDKDKIELSFDVISDVPLFVRLSDQDLYQIMSNILHNARRAIYEDYGSIGKISIVISNVDRFAHVIFRNTGRIAVDGSTGGGSKIISEIFDRIDGSVKHGKTSGIYSYMWDMLIPLLVSEDLYGDEN